MRLRRFLQLPRSLRRVQSDVDDELAFDLDMRERELVERGMTPSAAREQAVREFGDLERTRAYCARLDAEAERDSRRSEWFAETFDDARLALRSMRRMPGFVVVVLATLALGIGANTAIFSVVSRILIDRLPYRDADQLVRIYGGARPDGNTMGMMVAPGELLDIGEAKSLSGIAAYGNLGGFIYTGGEVAEPWSSGSVTGNFFALLGVNAELGRTIGERDEEPGAEPVVLLSHALWMRAFGGDPKVIGRVVPLSGQSRKIIGVMPASFVSPTFNREVWTPLGLARFMRNPVAARETRAFRPIARLRPGASIEGLRSDLAVIATRMRERYPTESERGTAMAVPLREAMVGDSRAALIAVMGAAALVLVITCINIAGLFLARASARRRELAVRGALGAGRSRLIRQLLTESAVYGLAGGALGIGLAYTAEGALAKVAASSLPNLGPIRIDGGVLGFAVMVSVVCGFAFGLMPALAATRVDLKESLGESSRGASQSGSRARGTQTLVVAQIALAIMLMVGAGLLVRSFASLTRTNLGFSTGKDVLTFRVNLVQRMAPAERNVLFAGILERVRGLSGVKQAGLAEIGPWNGPNGTAIRREGVTDPDGMLPRTLRATATEGFFSAVGMPIRRGRPFNSGDRFGAPGVVIVNESFARAIFGTANPIGQRLKVDAGGLAPDNAASWREVVGVVGDVRGNVNSEPASTVYVSDWQEPGGGADFVVRTTGDALVIVPAVRRILHELAPVLPLINPRTLRDVLSGFITQQRLAMALMGGFATLALLLAALGVYAVMAYAVTARTREFGIRSALGARRGTLLIMVVRQGMRTAVIGTAVGVVSAALGSRVLARLLTGVSPRDGLTFVAAAAVLLAVTFVACVIPARAATRVQPVDALRAE